MNWAGIIRGTTGHQLMTAHSEIIIQKPNRSWVWGSYSTITAFSHIEAKNSETFHLRPVLIWHAGL